jgi:hypothetical protein
MQALNVVKREIDYLPFTKSFALPLYPACVVKKMYEVKAVLIA